MKWFRQSSPKFPKRKFSFTRLPHTFPKQLLISLLLFTLTLCLTTLPSIAKSPTPTHSYTQSAPIAPAQRFEQGTALYQSGQFASAAEAFQQAAEAFQTQGDRLKQAAALSNLALAYQKLGQWQAAQETIAASLTLLNQQSSSTPPLPLLAQTLDIQASLQLAIGKSDDALATWQQATALYTQLKDEPGIFRSQINQAKALQVKGFYSRALKILEELSNSLETQPDSVSKVIALRSLGDALQLTGNLERSRKVLQQSLEIAARLQIAEEISAVYFSLGNTARAEQNGQEAIDFYRQASQTTSNPLLQIQAQVNQFNVFVHSNQLLEAVQLAEQLQSQLGRLPEGRDKAYIQINLAQAVIDLNQAWSTKYPDRPFNQKLITSVPDLLAQTVQQAQLLNDLPTQAYALGTLGYYYEQQGQWFEAQKWTEQALRQIQNITAPEIAYRYLWQAGRLSSRQGDWLQAKAAYEGAIAKLQFLRGDLASINRDAQFNFRDSVEPVYRQGVAVLLELEKTSPSEKNLNQAREWIEALQLAELDDYFRSACINAEAIVLDKFVDKDNPAAAIIYPIILENQLQVIAKIPGKPLKNYAVNLSQSEVETILTTLLPQMLTPSEQAEAKQLLKQVYDWLIQPIEVDLKQSGINTLVFVLDGAFRKIPMAALYDGQNYLVQKYAISLSLGLQLLQPRSLVNEPVLRAIAAGLTKPSSEFQDQFSSLPEIQKELELMRAAGIQMEVLLDKNFDSTSLAKLIRSLPFSIIHLATHAQFSSKANETFILAYDKKINVNEFDTLLRGRTQGKPEPIELLVLSACQTAAGDNRATLGLAGIAIRAGARSTLASLWKIGDEDTANFMGKFYKELVSSKVSKAEAVRRAQVSILEKFAGGGLDVWPAYVLVGNWL